MRNFFLYLFDNSFNACKRHKALTITLIVCVIVGIILGIVGGVQINNGMFPLDFSNVAYVKFLQNKLGFAGFLFTELFTLLIFILIIIISGINVWFIGIGILFFMYFVYAQTVTIISITMDFGFFNTIILLIFLVVISFCYFYLFVLAILQIFDCCGMHNYFFGCLKILLPIFLAFTIVVLCNVIFMMTLKNFVFVLVYK